MIAIKLDSHSKRPKDKQKIAPRIDPTLFLDLKAIVEQQIIERVKRHRRRRRVIRRDDTVTQARQQTRGLAVTATQVQYLFVTPAMVRPCGRKRNRLKDCRICHDSASCILHNAAFTIVTHRNVGVPVHQLPKAQRRIDAVALMAALARLIFDPARELALIV